MTLPKTPVVLEVLLVVLLLPNVLTKKSAISNGDPLTKARCDLFCMETTKDQRAECRNQCRQQHSKPGLCPTEDSPKWADACVEACNADGQCDGVQRCCRFACGSSCIEPVNLLSVPGLPAVPVISDIKERRRSVTIIWSDGVGDTAREVPGKVLYVVQEQHHLGPKYEQTRLGEWNFLTRTNKTKLSVRKLLKPGRWYRFRVAAINTSGTRGFSEPSAPFTPRRGPKPPAPPKKLKIRPLGVENGTFTVRLEWREPRSDLPVMKYKVFWSRRLRGLSGELDSVLVNHLTVPKNQTFVNIKSLQPDSMYFFQVQTISHFGIGKLRSEKVHIFFNTTSIPTNGNKNAEKQFQRQEPGSHTRNREAAQPLVKINDEKHVITGVKLREMVWNNNRIKARITWDAVRTTANEPTRYYVHWKAVKCENNPYKDLIASTEQPGFEIYELDYDCSYLVEVKWEINEASKNVSQIVINVPTCEHFKRQVKKNFVCNT